MRRSGHASPSPARPVARLPARLVAVALGTASCLLGLELGLRIVLFGGLPDLGALESRLRVPGAYTSTRLRQDYWTLKYQMQPPQPLTGPALLPDPEIGWRSGSILPNYLHRAHTVALENRVPILLFGDSFMQCTVPEADCFEGLLAASPFAGSIAPLNHGVGGHGFDQTLMLLERALPHWADRNPIVVVGFYVDDGFNRCNLSMREWPKPRFEWDGEQLVAHPPELDMERWLAEHPSPIRSYLARWMLCSSGLLPAGVRHWWLDERAAQSSAEQLARKLVERTCDVLEAAGVDAFFLLMPGKKSLSGVESDWQERLMVAALESRGALYYNAREDFEEELRGKRHFQKNYFASGHYNRRGNEVAFRALTRGLEEIYRRREARRTHAIGEAPR